MTGADANETVVSDPRAPVPDNGEPDPSGRSVLRECRLLARHFEQRGRMACLMLMLGLMAAAAETLGVGLAVMFLFAILGETEEVLAGGGLLGKAQALLGGVTGLDPYLLAAAIAVLIVGNALLIYAYDVMTAISLNHIAERMRDRVHEQYVRVAYPFLQKREHGALLHTLASETWTVSEAFYALARMAVNACAIVVFGLGLFLLSWQVALTALVCGLAAFAGLRLLSRPVRRLSSETLAANQVLAERMLVSLQGMRTLRAFAQEDHLLRVFAAASSRVRRWAIKAEWLQALVRPLGELAGLVTLVIIVLVATAASVGTPTIIAAVLLLFRMQPHVREIETHRLQLAGVSASLHNVRTMLDTEDKSWPSLGDIEFQGLQSAITFDDVTFTHDPRRGASLERVSLTIRHGEITALAGPSGSGKTTVINLLLRLYEPESGRVLVDGVDLNRLTRKSWLSRIAIAGQDVELIEGTVAQNLRLGARDASMEAVHSACRLVEIYDDLAALPEGFGARVGAAGLNFSGGQRQRIGLARALLRQPDILILDEAMSALEPALEDRIWQRLREAFADKTLVVVSHRSSGMMAVDANIAMARGRVVAPSVTPRVAAAGGLSGQG